MVCLSRLLGINSMDPSAQTRRSSCGLEGTFTRHVEEDHKLQISPNPLSWSYIVLYLLVT